MSLLAVSLPVLMTTFCHGSADARGGGGRGGGGGFRGGFDGGFRGFDGGMGRGDLGNRADGGAGRGAWGGDGGRGLGDGARPDPASYRSPVSESELRQGANQEYHWSSLPTDGGLGRIGGGSARPRVTSNVSRASMASRGLGVRNAFRRYDLFNNEFWNRYRGAWWYPGWGDYWPWEYTDWDDLCSFWGAPETDQPVEYDYGNNITYQDDTVYYGSQPLESAANYYNQAQALALAAPPSVPPPPPAAAKRATKAATTTKEKSTDWKPLGVFALTQGDQTDSNCIFQLAVNKNGIIRGNYFNPLTQEEHPVQGKFDKKSNRVAWTVGANKNVVYDTGISNLLAQQSSILIHLDKDTTQQWNIVRLKRSQT